MAAVGPLRRSLSARFSSAQRLSCLLSADLNRCSSLNLYNGRIFSTSSDLNNEKTELERNPFYHKYAQKIRMKEKTTDNQRLESKTQFDVRTKEAERIKAGARNHQQEKALLNHTSSSEKENNIQYGKETLDQVLHMDLIKELSGEEIAQIWKEYHGRKECISACIPSDVYQRIQEKAAEYPMFIYPIPRENGYEFMFGEFSGNSCFVTSLLQYQTSPTAWSILSRLGCDIFQSYGENSPWVLAIKHFTELKESKGIVLMVGEPDTKQLSVTDAQWLGYQIQMYYASNSAEKEDLLRVFNKEPEKFDHMSVIKLLEGEIASGAVNFHQNHQEKND